MRYLTVKRNKNGEPNKTDLKSLKKFFTSENVGKYADYDSYLFAVEETKNAGKEFIGYKPQRRRSPADVIIISVKFLILGIKLLYPQKTSIRA